MNVRPIRMALAAGLVSLSAPVSAQSLFVACEADVVQFCSAVTPGYGRLQACLYAHEDQISDSCDAAFGEMAGIMDEVFARLRYAKQECGADIQAHCADVAIGEGRLFSCLAEKKAELAPGCVELVDRVELPGD